VTATPQHQPNERPPASDPKNGVRWRLHLASPPEAVHQLLGAPAGRVRFWADKAPESDGEIHFRFPDGTRLRARVLANEPPSLFALDYFGADTRFELEPDGRGGTDLTLTSTDTDPETLAGWVSVLLALKAAADFDVDLRNHDPERTWAQGYVDN